MSISLSRLQTFYQGQDALPLLHMMIKEEFVGNIALLTSFGADASVLLALVAEVDKKTPVLFLDTGKHFPETLDYARDLTRQLGLMDVRWLTPNPQMLENTDASGELWKHQPNRCCWLRKVEPLNRAVDDMGIHALITGRKRYQTPERSEMQSIELDEHGIFRINPLADWDKRRQRDEMMLRGLPEHPLVAKGYRSIGCAPCTMPVEEGQDDRAGRWAHTIGIENEQKTECGIHVPNPGDMNWSV